MGDQKRVEDITSSMRIFKSLSQFYTSDEWRKFRQVVIAERVSKTDGVLYDEYSGKPILKSYEIILHHKIELTMQNVNDPEISLNPDNIMIVTPRSHNEIHNRFGGRLKSWQRKVYYVWGAPLSGKSSFVRENMQRGDLVLDIDKLWCALSGQPEYTKPNELKPIVFNARNAIFESIKMRAGNWQTAWVVECGALLGDRMRRIDALGAESVFIDIPINECLARLYGANTGRDVAAWERYIREWFEEYQADAE